MKYRHIFFSMVFVTVFPTLKAQDWKTELRVLNETYINATSFEMDIVIKSFGKVTDQEPLFTTEGKVVNNGELSYSEMMGKITLVNNRCLLLVDTRQKLILYRSKKSQDNYGGGKFSWMNLDSAILNFEKDVFISFLRNDEVEKVIAINYKSGPIDRVELFIRTSDQTLSNIIYYYDTSYAIKKQSVEKVVVCFLNVRLNHEVPSGLFDESKFINHKSGKVTSTGNYAQYELLEQDKPILE